MVSVRFPKKVLLSKTEVTSRHSMRRCLNLLWMLYRRRNNVVCVRTGWDISFLETTNRTDISSTGLGSYSFHFHLTNILIPYQSRISFLFHQQQNDENNLTIKVLNQKLPFHKNCTHRFVVYIFLMKMIRNTKMIFEEIEKQKSIKTTSFKHTKNLHNSLSFRSFSSSFPNIIILWVLNIIYYVNLL